MFGRKPAGKTRKNRFKKNKQQSRRRFIGHLMLSFKLGGLMALLLVVSAIFVMGYAAVTHSDYFRTQSVEISGLSRLTREAIMVQAGLRPGDNLLAVNLHLVRKRLLSHPWIAQARVERVIPGTLNIAVQENEALAVVDLGRKFLINTHGRLFKEYEDEEALNLPLVTGIAYADISLGDDALSPALNTVLKVLQASRAPGSALAYSDIARVRFDAQMGILLTERRTRRTVKLGFDHFKEKYSRLNQLWPYLKNNQAWSGFKTIDLNNPDRVVVQLGTSPNSRGGA